jgi:hypothetical protein
MTYIENLQKHHSEITQRFSEAKTIKSAFTPEQVNELFQQQFILAEGAKWTASSRNIQTSVDIDTLFNNCTFLDEVFKDLVGDYYKHHSGNFYVTTQLHDAHVDLLTEEETNRFEWAKNVVPYKSCVIPLVITDGADAHTAFFNERHVGTSITFDRVEISSQENSDYEIAREYPDLYDINGNIIRTEEWPEKTGFLFPQIPRGNMQGLSIETVLEFIPGDVMIFDACQIHASCVKRSKPNYKWLKSGINLQFYKEV